MRFWKFTSHMPFLRETILAFHHKRHAEAILLPQTFCLDPSLLLCGCRGNAKRLSEAASLKNRFSELRALQKAHFSSEAGKLQIWILGRLKSVIRSVHQSWMVINPLQLSAGLLGALASPRRVNTVRSSNSGVRGHAGQAGEA